jgi:Domain of unknown function (DUF4288)
VGTLSDVWFSAMLRFVIVTPDRVLRRARSLVLLRAADWEPAQAKALELGRGQEREYSNAAGELVRWRLEALETLDRLGEEIPDGREVYAEPLDAPGTLEAPPEPDPTGSRPEQSGV